MKKKFLIVIPGILLVTALLFNACSKNDDNCCNPVPGSQGNSLTEASSNEGAAGTSGEQSNNATGGGATNQTSGLSPASSSSTLPQNGGSSGILSSFQTVDMNNNQVDQSVFQGKKLTMVNIWATFCGPCISEMPELGEINREYSAKGFQIIGIPVDVLDRKGNIDSGMVSTAKEIIKKTNADYLHLLPSDSLMRAKLSEVSSVPETIFVDENGKQVGKSYLGSRSKEKWEIIINDLLEQVK